MKKIINTIIAVSIIFSSATNIRASNKTPIMGDSILTAEQMEIFVHNINPNATYLAQIFLDEGAKEGVKGDLAYAQSLKETGYFKYGGVVQPDYNNFSGIGAIDPTAIGNAARFATQSEGVRAQIQHLKAYASTDPLNLEQIDPRFHLVTRGIAPNIEDLNGRWAVPGDGYGESIVDIYNKIAQVQTTQTSDSIKPARVNARQRFQMKLRQTLENSRCKTIRSKKLAVCNYQISR